MMGSLNDLIKKYDVPVPRYTSYPTVPLWDADGFDPARWPAVVKKIFDESNRTKGISLYIHLPFCESLCTYCACNTRITKNHKVEEKYIDALLREWRQYLAIFGTTPVIRELHLGGGTPTFFSPQNLEKLIGGITGKAVIHPQMEFSFEGHPNNTTREHLQTLNALGFRRVSYGVQDLDPRVQQAIHRMQPFGNLQRVTDWSRETGYESVSFDLIYGLPYQTTDTVTNTIEQVIQLRPGRVSYYSYAHVPWMRPGQRGYEDADLPGDVMKRALYETGRRLFKEAGYSDVGMDHFSLPGDPLYAARRNGTLHRNFMGYTTSHTDLLIGLGVSAISDARYAYAQNVKQVEAYNQSVQQGNLPIVKGHLQQAHDLLAKECILQVACKGKLSAGLLNRIATPDIVRELKIMEDEGLVSHTSEGLEVTPTGRIFIRNICSLFDRRMREHKTAGSSPVFSKAI